jgi:hypothetical protein
MIFVWFGLVWFWLQANILRFLLFFFIFDSNIDSCSKRFKSKYFEYEYTILYIFWNNKLLVIFFGPK